MSTDILIGTEDDDILIGGNSKQEIYGLGGNDKLLGGNAPDLLNGGTGRDVYCGGHGPDIFQYRTGDLSLDKLHRDVLVAGKGDDVHEAFGNGDVWDLGDSATVHVVQTPAPGGGVNFDLGKSTMFVDFNSDGKWDGAITIRRQQYEAYASDFVGAVTIV